MRCVQQFKLITLNRIVARMKRSVIRGQTRDKEQGFPDSATLHPGYGGEGLFTGSNPTTLTAGHLPCAVPISLS
jgi:hypothetical protein